MSKNTQYDGIWFIHVPKTGGVSIEQWLREAFGADLTQRIGPGTGGEPNVNDSTVAVVSHWPPNSDKYKQARKGRRWYTVTFLRHPVDRVMAHYHHVKADADFGTSHDMLQNMSLFEWLQVPEHFGTTRNMQTRYFSRKFNAPTYHDARQWLKGNGDFVGFTAAMDWSLNQLASRLIEIFPDYVETITPLTELDAPWLNAWAPAGVYDPEAIDTILAYNQHDTRLHDYLLYSTRSVEPSRGRSFTNWPVYRWPIGQEAEDE